MTKVNWLIQKGVFDDGNPKRLYDLVISRGMECQWVDHIISIGKHYNDEDCVIAYGSINFVMQLMRNKPWVPTAWFNLHNLQCTNYYAHWGKYLLQQDYSFLPWAEIRRKTDYLYNRHGESNNIFIRPNSNTKVFTGSVVKLDEFENWYKKIQDCYNPDKESLVVVARPQNITHEWRFVVADKKVLTGYLYKVDHEDNSLFTCAARVLADEIASDEWQPDVMYVLDICKTGDGEHHLLEIGSWNTAGLYKCDLDVIVEKASELAIKQWDDVH